MEARTESVVYRESNTSWKRAWREEACCESGLWPFNGEITHVQRVGFKMVTMCAGHLDLERTGRPPHLLVLSLSGSVLALAVDQTFLCSAPCP